MTTQTVVRLAVALLLAPAPSIAQTTFTVNSTADPGDGTCDASECTLREAITAANGAPGADQIHFAIPGPGVHTIAPAAAFPNIAGPVTIDGYSQPGASQNTLAVGNDAVLLIEVAGAGSGRPLILVGAGAVVRGLVVNGFGDGIFASEGSTGHVIAGNFVGTDPTGTVDLGNGVGVYLFRANNVLVGGTTPADRNVISGNGEGITLSDAPSNTIRGNYIGTNAAGTAAIGNGTGIGIGSVFGGSNANVVGGTVPGAGNVISGNGASGLALTGDHDNVVQGNLIGTSATGDAAVPNGIGISAGGNPGVFNLVIGGTEAGAGNTISGNAGRGVNFAQTATGRMVVRGNRIGVALDGATPLGNDGSGIHVGFFTGGFFGGGPATVGGTEPGAANTIAYNAEAGVAVICCDGRPSTVSGNRIFGNGGLGFDLGGFNPDGPTANDAGDADIGANRLQNTPVLANAGITGGGEFGATYHVDSAPANAAYPLTVEFFRALDGEGAAFLGADTYTESDYSGCGTPPCAKTATFAPAATVTVDDLVVSSATDATGNTSEFGASPTVVVAAGPSTTSPQLRLHSPSPNPATGRATIRYQLPAAGRVLLALYDALGREVAVLVDGERPAGAYAAEVDAGALAAGAYVLRIRAAGAAAVRRFSVLR